MKKWNNDRAYKLGIQWARSNRVGYHTRLLGITTDDRLSWSQHLTDVKKSFVNKVNLIKRSSFLGREALLDLHYQVVLPAVLYGLIVWGGCANAEQLNSLESLHRGWSTMSYNEPHDMPSADVYRHSKWSTLSHMLKLWVIKLFHKFTMLPMHYLSKKTNLVLLTTKKE